MRNQKNTFILAAGLLTVLSGCATTQATHPKDPLESWNRSVQSFNDTVDSNVMKPVAKGYRWVMPSFVDQGVSNFFSNVNDIGVAINDVLQGKFLQSGMDSARLLVNTTAGVGGFVDVASMIDLPKHKEDFDQTLGYWGLPSGPYLVLPFFGPSSARGVAGLLGDAAMNPISYTGIYVGSTWLSSAISGGLSGTHAIDARADALQLEKVATAVAKEGKIDRYELFRDHYFAERKNLVEDGKGEDVDVLKDMENGSTPFAPY